MGICPSADGQSESKISEANCKSAQLMREQNRRNAQLVPIYRGQPANEHRRVLAAGPYLLIFRLVIPDSQIQFCCYIHKH